MTSLAQTFEVLRRRRLIVAGGLLAAALLLLGPFLPKPQAGDVGPSHSELTARRDPSWAGGLELPQTQVAAAQEKNAPATSASYTTGFDEKAAGLGPLPPEHPVLRLAQPRNPLACPDDLNCTFRNARGPLPPRRLAAAAGLKHSKAASSQSGFFLPLIPVHLNLPTPHLSLPSADTLLTPFTYVSNTVVGFVKKM